MTDLPGLHELSADWANGSLGKQRLRKVALLHHRGLAGVAAAQARPSGTTGATHVPGGEVVTRWEAGGGEEVEGSDSDLRPVLRRCWRTRAGSANAATPSVVHFSGALRSREFYGGIFGAAIQNHVQDCVATLQNQSCALSKLTPLSPFALPPRVCLCTLSLGSLQEKWPSDVIALGDVVGGLSSEAAAHLGLREGLPVAQGGADAFVGMGERLNILLAAPPSPLPHLALSPCLSESLPPGTVDTTMCPCVGAELQRVCPFSAALTLWGTEYLEVKRVSFLQQ